MVYAAKTDLVLDEAQYWTWSRELAFGYFSKPPMIAWVIRAASELCGDSEACIRSASPVLYTLAAFMLYLTGRALYGPRVGFWSAIVFATLPGVSYSANLITTDVPPILFWTIALYAWVMLCRSARRRHRAWPPCQAGDDLRCALHRLSCDRQPRGAELARDPPAPPIGARSFCSPSRCRC